jgi:hypothetical protein
MYINMSGATIDPKTLGGGIPGVSTKQTTTSFRSSEDAAARGILRRAWNTPYATGEFNGNKRVIGPFRAVNNLGDFLSRVNYSSGGPNQVKTLKAGTKKLGGAVIDKSDGTGVPASSTNVKFVPDSSDYITYKKQAAMNRNYNDSSTGGDQSNASFVPMGRARR